MKASQNIAMPIPDAFLHRMSGMLGNHFDEFQSSLQLPAIMGLRVNTLKISVAQFIHQSPFVVSAVPWSPSGFIIQSDAYDKTSISPGKHPYHNIGLYYLQEPSAMAAAEILSPQPGEKILDLAAAPGGKTTHIAALMNNEGLLVANEIHPKRVWDLVENLERCGVTNAVITNDAPQKLADHFGEYFDRVMLDAPCSGEGMFRKSDTARKEWKPELVNSCANRQYFILEQAVRMLKPGGYLAYTTCTFSAEENEGVISKFLSNHPEFNLESVKSIPGYQRAQPEWIGLEASHPINQAVRIWPHLSQGEGHFIALLRKLSSSENQAEAYWIHPRSLSKQGLNSKSIKISKATVEGFYKENLNFALESSRILIDGSYVYQLPDPAPELKGLNIIHPGWWLGSINKTRFKPSHSLAMGIKSSQAKHIFELMQNDQQISSFFGGASLQSFGENEWVLLTLDTYPIGWGKRVQNVIKNYYPHGLRHGT